MRVKMYVQVNADHKIDGTCTPNTITFASGRKYEIDDVETFCRAASTKAGGTGVRYTIIVHGQKTFLYDEENGKWFVEAKYGRTI